MNIKAGTLQLLKKMLILCFVFVLFGGGIMLIMPWGFWEDSGYSNCVVVSDESHFIGERMKYSHAITHRPMLHAKCLELDQEIDQGNGPLKGKVRWAECLKGPDCDEAGMF